MTRGTLYGLLMKMRMFQGMVPTMQLRVDTILGNAVVNKDRRLWYLDTDFDWTSE